MRGTSDLAASQPIDLRGVGTHRSADGIDQPSLTRPSGGGEAEVAIQLVNSHLSPAKARLLPPSPTGYLLLAAEIDRRPMFLPDSARKAELIANVKRLANAMTSLDGVIRTTVFKGFARLVIAENHALLRHAAAASRLERARYDLVILVESTSPTTAASLRRNGHYQLLAGAVRSEARHTFEIAAHNERNMGDVDVTRPGVFLFNFFYGDDARRLIPVWEYTAGWWMSNTGLTNSRVIVPLEGERQDYGIINHCRWDHLRDVAPNLIFRPSFRKFVLANFAANRMSPQPTLYRLA